MCKPFLRTAKIPNDGEALIVWSKLYLHLVDTEDWDNVNSWKRWIPVGERLPPVFLAGLSTRVDRLAATWHMNSIRWTPTLSRYTNNLHMFLDKSTLRVDEVEEVDIVLQAVLAANDNLSFRTRVEDTE